MEALGDAIVMRERDKSHRQRETKVDALDSLDVGDLLVDGVELVWKLIRR